jgi:MoaA/NifB/PqqE/SkfB family radical SAM enzyme
MIVGNTLTIEVTTKCNIRCNNCFALADLPQKSNLDYDTAKAIAKEGIDTGFRVLHLTGGEPTLWKHFIELIRYSLDIGYQKIQFNTNGIPLDAEFCKRLQEYNEMIEMSISINGTKDLHEKVRGRGTYRKTIEGLENALKSQLKVEIFTTIGKDLLKEFPLYANALFTEYPSIQGLTLIQLHRVENDFYDIKEDLLTPEDFISLVKQVSLLNLYGHRIGFLYNPYASVVGKILGIPLIPQSRERISRIDLVVLKDLKITGNHSSRREYGYYERGSLQRIKESIASIPNEESTICTHCMYISQCKENGIHNPAPEDLDFEVVPFCQRTMALI